MAFHDARCPCGSKKEPDTLLCDRCRADAAETDMRMFADEQGFTQDSRRNAGIRRLAARRRSRRRAA